MRSYSNPFDDDLLGMDAYVPKPNLIQKGLQVGYRFTTGMTTTLFFGLKVFPPMLPLPYNEAVNFTMVNVNIQIGDTLGALLTKERPMANLARIGKGSVCLGLTKEAGKFVAALVPPAAAGLGAGYLLLNYGDALAGATHPALQALNVVWQEPLIRESLFGLVSWGLHSGTKALIDCCMLVPPLAYEYRPKLHKLQQVASLLLRPLSPIALYEVLRMALEVAGQESGAKSFHFPIILVACDQLLQAWAYTGFVPRPLKNLVPESPRVYVPHGLEEGALIQPTVKPSAQAQAHGLAWHALRSGTVIAVGGYLLNMGVQWFLNDSAAVLTTAEEVAVCAGMIYVTAATEKLVEYSPQAIAWAGSGIAKCYAGLFNKPQGAIPVPRDHYQERDDFIASYSRFNYK